MWIDLREVELPGNEEDHRANGREPAIAAGFAFGRLEESVQGLEEAVGLTPLDQVKFVYSYHGR